MIMTKRAFYNYVSAIVILLVFSAGAVSAQTSGAGTDLCGGDALSKMFCAQNNSLPSMLNQAFQISISIGAILAMLRIGFAGYLYMGSADMWSSKSKAKEVFQNAIFGLLLLLAIYLILYQINPQILELKLLQTAPGLDQVGSQAAPAAAPAPTTPAGPFNSDPINPNPGEQPFFGTSPGA